MKSRIFFILLGLIMLTPIASAQRPNQTSNLSKEDIAAFTERAKIKIDQFNKMLSFIASPHQERVNNTEEEANVLKAKDKRIRQALQLFMGKGYSYKDIYGNEHDHVTMETSSINRSTGKVRKNTRATRLYLENMKNNSHRYSKVDISATDCYLVNEAYEVEDGVYKAVIAYMQKYTGWREDRIDYSDLTEKYVEVYIYRTEIDGEDRWNVLLGNIYVEMTE